MPSSAKHEVWVYDRANAARKKVTNTAAADPPSCTASSYRPTITSLLQDYWGATGSDSRRANTSGYDLSVAGASGASSSCQFLAAAGMLPAPNTIEPLTPSISKDGRMVAFVSGFVTETVARVTDDAAGVGPITTHNAFVYDRVLGTTTRLTRMPASAVAGQATCCPAASSSTATGSCSHKDRLLGKCCEQKPCRIGAMNAEVSGDGQKVAFLSDVAYGGTSVNSPKSDLELFIHHIPTDTTHRISHTFDKDWDETFPHINHDGTVIVWESKSASIAPTFNHPTPASHALHPHLKPTPHPTTPAPPTALRGRHHLRQRRQQGRLDDEAHVRVRRYGRKQLQGGRGRS